MLNGTAGLLCEKVGGSTRRNGDEEARRLEMALIRLCLGEPRLVLRGVDFAVLDGVRILRAGTEGVALSEMLGLTGDVMRLNLEGLTKSRSNPELVLDFLVGELNNDGSMFSESTSSKTSGARWRLPVEGAGVGFKEEGPEKGDTAAQSRLVFSFQCSNRRLLTILPVFSTLQCLETRCANLGKGLARKCGHGSECGG